MVDIINHLFLSPTYFILTFDLIQTLCNLFEHVHSCVNVAVSDWCKRLRNDTDCLACDNQSECYIFSPGRQEGIILIARKLRYSRFNVLVRSTRPDSLISETHTDTSWRKPESSHWLFTVFCWSAVCPFSLAPDWWKHWMIKWIKLYLLHNTLPLDSSKSLNQTTDFFIVPSPLSFAMLGMMCWPSQCHDDNTLISVYLKVVSL